jgi:SAM-dependent methyltransferase
MISNMKIDWESCYIQGETPWDHGQASPPLLAEIARRPLAGRVLVIGCGPGHDVAALADQGLDVTGLDIAPSAVAKAQANYPQHAARFIEGDLFDLAPDLRAAFDVVVEHTCLSGMPPDLRPLYAGGVRAALKPGGQITGIWYINPDLDPGHEGPPFPLPVETLDALFTGDFDIVADYIPDTSFAGRHGRERVRVLRHRA